MPDNSFDIASKIDLAEVGNAIQQKAPTFKPKAYKPPS